MNVKPSSKLALGVSKSKYLRIIGRKFVKTYDMDVGDGIRLRVRTGDAGSGYIIDEIWNKKVYEKKVQYLEK